MSESETPKWVAQHFYGQRGLGAAAIYSSRVAGDNERQWERTQDSLYRTRLEILSDVWVREYVH